MTSFRKKLLGSIAGAGALITATLAFAGNSAMVCEGLICDAVTLSGTPTSYQWSASWPLSLAGPNGHDSAGFNCAVPGGRGRAELRITYADGTTQEIARTLFCGGGF